MEQIATSLELLDFVRSNLDTITYGGGDVSQASGDAIASKSNVFNFNGSTETGVTLCFVLQVHILLRIGNIIEFRPSAHGLYEAYIVSNAASENEQPVFKIFLDLTDYSTKDLWTLHPSKPGLWKYHGRADGIIVFGPGYMCNPISMEQHVSNHPEIRAALMAVTGRFQPVLLIELVSEQSPSASGKQKLAERLWPKIEEASQTYKIGARVSETHVLLADPQQPFQRA
ncbi:MAG: hypothetical protein Q9187_006150 [Circinaria calcarea]